MTPYNTCGPGLSDLLTNSLSSCLDGIFDEMAPQMAWPEPGWEEEETKNRGLSMTTTYKEGSYKEESKFDDDLVLPSDGLAVDFKHDLHRGLKSRQIAMVIPNLPAPGLIKSRLPSEVQLEPV